MPALIDVRLIFKNGVIRAGGKRADKVVENTSILSDTSGITDRVEIALKNQNHPTVLQIKSSIA